MEKIATATDLVVLDFDGTATLLPHDADVNGSRVTNSTWARVDRRVLDTDRLIATRFNRRHFIERKVSGIFTDEDELVWLNLSVHAWRECRLHRDHIKEIFAENEPHLRPGFIEFLRWLKAPRADRRVVVAINSYGFVEIIGHILERIGAAELVDEICAMEMMFDPDGHFLGYEPDSVVLTSIKAKLTKALLDKYGIPPARAIGIGDSDGDAMIVPQGGTRLLIAPDDNHVQTYGKHFHASVVTRDWSGIQAWLSARCGL
jgi:phosphoserine phosphatase